MRYLEDTKQFWRLGYKLFGARFTNFMGGYKHHGQVVRSETVKGYYSPASASINFAVPNDKILRQFVRSFSYCTSKKAVYEMVDKADKEHYHTDVDESYPGQTIPSNIIT
ncbi:hypothetical protein MAR_005718, partial [Mya arenaria]